MGVAYFIEAVGCGACSYMSSVFGYKVRCLVQLSIHSLLEKQSAGTCNQSAILGGNKKTWSLLNAVHHRHLSQRVLVSFVCLFSFYFIECVFVNYCMVIICLLSWVVFLLVLDL